MVASSLEIGEMILVTNVYAPIDLHSKIKLWAHIRHVKSYYPFLPCIVARDFNSIVSLEEKWGGLTFLGPSSRENIDLNLLMGSLLGTIEGLVMLPSLHA